MPVILSPHAGEFARLSGIENPCPAELTLFARKYNCIVLYKGHRTLIAAPDGALYRNHSGNPGMAKGGSGDLLAGIIGGMLARGVPALYSAAAGAYIAGKAAEKAVKNSNEYSLLPSETAAYVADAVTEIINKNKKET